MQSWLMEWVDGQDTLEYLERANLFIVPMDSERGVVPIPSSLWESVTQRLGQKNTDVEISKLHIRASEWDEKNHGISKHFNMRQMRVTLGGLLSWLNPLGRSMQDNFQSAAWLRWVKSFTQRDNNNPTDSEHTDSPGLYGCRKTRGK